MTLKQLVSRLGGASLVIEVPLPVRFRGVTGFRCDPGERNAVSVVVGWAVDVGQAVLVCGTVLTASIDGGCITESVKESAS